jgi:PEP-CTERM motif
LRILKTIVASAIAVAATGASAASFTQASGFGVANVGNSCELLQNTTAFATGTVLDGSMAGVENCVGWFQVDLDVANGLITLTGLEHGNYEFGFLEITGITEVTILSLSTLSYTSLFDPDYYADPAVYGGIPAPVLSFTGSSIRIDFSTLGETPPQFTYDGDGGTAVFAFNAGNPIPEPATWGMMILGFGLVGSALRRKSMLAA